MPPKFSANCSVPGQFVVREAPSSIEAHDSCEVNFFQPNSMLTDSFRWMRLMACPNSEATETTLIFGSV